MSFEIDYATTAMVSVIASGAVALLSYVVRVTWWIRKEFEEIRHYLTQKLDAHEDKDQVRHEDNIQRFTKIEVKLDTIIKNGH